MVVDKKTSKLAFAGRLDHALAIAGVPDDRDRRKWVSKTFGVSVESARKWLMGEVMPDTARIEGIARELDCNANWLLSGADLNLSGMVKDVLPIYDLNSWANKAAHRELYAALQAAHDNGSLGLEVSRALTLIVKTMT